MTTKSNSELIAETYTEAVKGIDAEWFTSGNTEWYDYIMKLPNHLRITYMVIIFDTQVFNGGFDQYFVNEYGQFAKETINALNTIKSYKRAKLLEQALQYVNVKDDPDIEFRKKLLKHDIPELFVNNELSDRLNELDTLYYELEEVENLEQLLGDYLSAYI